ncbi:hypothetical protein F444_14936, partial [Phytophthora nicotianae P1976]
MHLRYLLMICVITLVASAAVGFSSPQVVKTASINTLADDTVNKRLLVNYKATDLSEANGLGQIEDSDDERFQ